MRPSSRRVAAHRPNPCSRSAAMYWATLSAVCARRARAAAAADVAHRLGVAEDAVQAVGVVGAQAADLEPVGA